jgi:DNA-binding MarR family transcriptional regulator
LCSRACPPRTPRARRTNDDDDTIEEQLLDALAHETLANENALARKDPLMASAVTCLILGIVVELTAQVYVVAGALSNEEGGRTLRDLAATLRVDHTLVHRALKRAEHAGLYRSSTKQVNAANFEELTIHAVRFIAPARLGELTRGVPAAWAAEPISTIIRRPVGRQREHRPAGATKP